MINLLPPKEKKELQQERYKKLVAVLGFTFLVSLVCLALILYALKFYILQRWVTEKANLTSTTQQYEKDSTAIKNEIRKYNVAFGKLQDFYKTEVYFSEMLKFIIDIQRPNGVSFDTINLSLNKEGDRVKVSINGTSNTRENLLEYKERLENSLLMENKYRMENIYFPPESWVKPTGISFKLSFDIIE